MKRKFICNDMETVFQPVTIKYCHPLFNKKQKERERRKNTTQVVDMDKNILANDNTMDWFGFLGAIVALWSLIL
jgi:hypothetical protein